MTRRTFLKLGAATTAGLFALSVQQALANDVANAGTSGFRQASLRNPDYRLIWHNVADNPVKLRQSLGFDVLPEVDVIASGGALYVADSALSFGRLRPPARRVQRLENVLVEIARAGRSPAFDVKISGSSHLRDLEAAIDALVPRDGLVVVSGIYESVTSLKLAGHQNLILVPTVGPANLDTYFRDAEHWTSTSPGVPYGATVRADFARQSEILEFDVGRGLQTNVFGVKNEQDAAYFISRGATFITTDQAPVLARARKTA